MLVQFVNMTSTNLNGSARCILDFIKDLWCTDEHQSLLKERSLTRDDHRSRATSTEDQIVARTALSLARVAGPTLPKAGFFAVAMLYSSWNFSTAALVPAPK